MALNFPDDVTDNERWTDDCGNEWIYNEATNSWSRFTQTIPGDTFVFEDLDDNYNEI